MNRLKLDNVVTSKLIQQGKLKELSILQSNSKYQGIVNNKFPNVTYNSTSTVADSFSLFSNYDNIIDRINNNNQYGKLEIEQEDGSVVEFKVQVSIISVMSELFLDLQKDNHVDICKCKEDILYKLLDDIVYDDLSEIDLSQYKEKTLYNILYVKLADKINTIIRKLLSGGATNGF